jgi:hypothetical protein
LGAFINLHLWLHGVSIIGFPFRPTPQGDHRDRHRIIPADWSNPAKLSQLFRHDWTKPAAFITGDDEACLTMLNCLSEDFVLHHRAQPAE